MRRLLAVFVAACGLFLASTIAHADDTPTFTDTPTDTPTPSETPTPTLTPTPTATATQFVIPGPTLPTATNTPIYGINPCQAGLGDQGTLINGTAWQDMTSAHIGYWPTYVSDGHFSEWVIPAPPNAWTVRFFFDVQPWTDGGTFYVGAGASYNTYAYWDVFDVDGVNVAHGVPPSGNTIAASATLIAGLHHLSHIDFSGATGGAFWVNGVGVDGVCGNPYPTATPVSPWPTQPANIRLPICTAPPTATTTPPTPNPLAFTPLPVVAMPTPDLPQIEPGNGGCHPSDTENTCHYMQHCVPITHMCFTVEGGGVTLGHLGVYGYTLETYATPQVSLPDGRYAIIPFPFSTAPAYQCVRDVWATPGAVQFWENAISSTGVPPDSSAYLYTVGGSGVVTNTSYISPPGPLTCDATPTEIATLPCLAITQSVYNPTNPAPPAFWIVPPVTVPCTQDTTYNLLPQWQIYIHSIWGIWAGGYLGIPGVTLCVNTVTVAGQFLGVDISVLATAFIALMAAGIILSEIRRGG